MHGRQDRLQIRFTKLNISAVKLPDKTIRRVDITIKHIYFNDESIWNPTVDGKLEKFLPNKELVSNDQLQLVKRIMPQVTRNKYTWRNV